MSDIVKGRALPKRLLDSVVRTRNDDAVALGSLVQPKPTALVFIRHFGCLGCSVQMADLAPGSKKCTSSASTF